MEFLLLGVIIGSVRLHGRFEDVEGNRDTVKVRLWTRVTSSDSNFKCRIGTLPLVFLTLAAIHDCVVHELRNILALSWNPIDNICLCSGKLVLLCRPTSSLLG